MRSLRKRCSITPVPKSATKDPHVPMNPLTAGAVHTRFLHFLLAHYISAFKHNTDKKVTIISKI